MSTTQNTAPTFTFEDSGWDGACVFSWDADGYGDEIGRANFTNEISKPASVTVRLNNGRERSGFTSADEALVWIAANA